MGSRWFPPLLPCPTLRLSRAVGLGWHCPQPHILLLRGSLGSPSAVHPSGLTPSLPGWTKTRSRQTLPQPRPAAGNAPALSSPSPTTKPSSVSSPKRRHHGCRCGRSARSPTNQLCTATPSQTSPTPTSAPSKSSARPTRSTSRPTGCPAPPPPPQLWGLLLPAPIPASAPRARKSSSSRVCPRPEPPVGRRRILARFICFLLLVFCCLGVFN